MYCFQMFIALGLLSSRIWESSSVPTSGGRVSRTERERQQRAAQEGKRTFVVPGETSIF